MYELFGFPGFLAAYNAGPKRVDWFMAGTPLPAETVNYLAVISPRLAGTTVAEGPLAAYVRGPMNGAASGPIVINVAQALQDYAPAPGGPQVVSLAQGARPAPPPREQNGLVPRGMLNGPQLVAMPAAVPEQGQAHVAIPVPPQVLASMLRANRR